MNTAHNFAGHPSPDPHVVTLPLEILAILRSIMLKKTLIRLYVPGRVATMLTMLLEVDVKNNTLVFDCAGDDELNQRILSFNKLIFETSVEKIHVQFSTTQLTPCIHDGRPALSANFPVDLIYQQRRILFRISTPVIEPVICLIPLINGKGKGMVAAPLYDISAGGIAIFDDDQKLDTTVGTIYEDCTIALPGFGTIKVALRMEHARQKELANDVSRYRVGCSYVQANGATLSLIQRYVGKLERELIAKQRGLM